MANEKNLIAGAHKLTVDEQSKGGKKSGQARRKKKTLSELARMIADNPAPDNVKRKLVQLGIDEENADNNAAVAASVYRSALKGNMLAVEKWEQLTAVSEAARSSR